MNHLLAKIKNRSRTIEDGYRKLLSEVKLYDLPTELDAIEYSPNTLIDDGQWFSIKEFSEQPFCLPLLKERPFDSVEFNMLKKNEFSIMDFLCSYEDGYYCFQKVRPSQLLRKKYLVFKESCCEYDENSANIVINSFPDAFYIPDTDTLYFQKLETVSTIFKGIDVLYREATEEETNQFLHKSFITLQDDMCASRVGKSTRKSIALALNILNNFSVDQQNEILVYTKAYSGLQMQDNTFIISNEKELKQLIWGISERYYETPISGQRRVANSIIEI